jgi:protein gp37
MKVSAGCANCYAEEVSRRYGFHKIWGDNTRRHFSSGHWRKPILWDAAAGKKRIIQTVFCGSMCDVFEIHPRDKKAMDHSRLKLWSMIETTPCLLWLLLTKRPENIIDLVPWSKVEEWPYNVAVGVSVEDQVSANQRIPELLKIPARVRFLSIEPLLAPVDLESDINWLWEFNDSWEYGHNPKPRDPGIDWVIVGGESGSKARYLNLDWIRDLRDQCFNAKIPFFVKQLGTAWARENSYGSAKKGEAWELWPEDLQIRQKPLIMATKDLFPATQKSLES